LFFQPEQYFFLSQSDNSVFQPAYNSSRTTPKLQQASCHERPAHEMVNNVECFIIVSLSRLQEKPISPAMIDLSID
jgi:hypothetical protein